MFLIWGDLITQEENTSKLIKKTLNSGTDFEELIDLPFLIKTKEQLEYELHQIHTYIRNKRQ